MSLTVTLPLLGGVGVEGVSSGGLSVGSRGGASVGSGVREGSEISVYYDPLICKLITYGKVVLIYC